MNCFWFNPETKQLVPYNPTQHLESLYKFLFWKGESVMLTGPDKQGLDCHRDLFDSAIKTAGSAIPERIPDGAGTFEDGEIVSWGSEGFNMGTPEELRSEIKMALGIE